MRGYVQQFHDEAGDAVDRSTWTDLTRLSDTQLTRLLVRRIAVAVLSVASIVIGSVGVAVLPWSRVGHRVAMTSPLVIPSMIAVIAGLLFLGLALGGLWRVLNHRGLRRFTAEAMRDPEPVVHPGITRSHA